jgi:hypothetical protein
VPSAIVENRGEFYNVLQRIVNLIDSDFEENSSIFQLTANYYLIHDQTQELKKSPGSFSAKHNVPARITDFVEYDSASFVPFVLENTSDLNEKLSHWHDPDTAWQFNELLSVIINFQA